MYLKFIKSFAFILSFSLSFTAFINLTSAETQLMQAAPNSVYRFYNPATNKHVMMADYTEANNIFQFNKNWMFDGVAFVAFEYDSNTQTCKTQDTNINNADLLPVYRFYNANMQSHFFAMGDEVAEVEKNAAWLKEGIVFCAAKSTLQNESLLSAYRYYRSDSVSHVYTIDIIEKSNIDKNPSYIQEGVVFKVLPALGFGSQE